MSDLRSPGDQRRASKASTPPTAPQKRFKAFISYSWADREWGEWAHRALETYRTPRALIGKASMLGPVPARLHPIFKDREEEAAGAGITASIEAAMAASDFLLVICSPSSATSKWVNHEIAWYKRQRDKTRILALIVDGEPGASAKPGREAQECFPPALIYKVDDDLQPTDEPEDVPLAADARKVGDGKRGAKLKLAAAMLGLGLDDLVRRDERRRTIRRRVMISALALFSAWMTGNTWFAITQRNEAQAQRRIAEAQTENVNAALDYLVALFEIANPATENEKTITAQAILERGRVKIDAELGDKPAVRARLLNAIGMVYQNLGDVKKAGPILEEAAKGPFFSLGDEVRAKMDHAEALTSLRSFDRSKQLIDQISASIDRQAEETPSDEIDFFRMRVADQRAKAAYWQSKHDIAIEQYGQAKALCETTALCTPVQRASLSNNLSIALSESGRLDAARMELLVVKEIYLKEYGPDHLRTAITNQNIAYTDFLAGDYQLALTLMPSVVAIYEKLLDENHPLRATATMLLGRLYYAAGDDGKAIEALDGSLSAFQSAYGSSHNQIAVVSIYRSLALARNGQAEAALAALRSAEAIYRSEYSGDDPNFGDLEAHKGFVLAMCGRGADAAAACKRGVAQMARSLQPDDSWLAEIKTQCDPILSKIATNGN